MADDFQRKIQVWIWQGDRFLLLKTTEKRGAFWQPVTGKVEDEESLEQGALREAREESGLMFGDQLPLPLDFEFEFEGKWGPAREVAFALEAPDGREGFPQILIDPTEHQDFAWLRKDEVLERLKWPSNRQAFEKLLEYLDPKGKSK